MGNIRVEYSITLKTANGKELSFDKNRILTEQDKINHEHVQQILEQDFRETEQTSFLTAMQTQLGEEITSTKLKVTKIVEIQSAGDDDQM